MAPSNPIGRHPGATLVAAGLFWSGGGLISRASPLDGPELAFWRCLVAAVVYQGLLALRHHPPSLAALRAAAVAGAGFGTSVACLFVAYKSTTMLSAAVIGSLQPLALAAVTHRAGGRLGRVLWSASAIASVGTCLAVAASSSQGETWSMRGDLVAGAGVVANMVYVIGVKRARRTHGPLEVQAAMLWVAALVVAPLAIGGSGETSLPSAPGWWSVVALIAVGGTGHLLFSAAQGYVSVAASSAILLTEVLGVSVGAAVFFDQPLGPIQFLGMCLVAGSVGVWLRSSPAEAGEPITPLDSDGALPLGDEGR